MRKGAERPVRGSADVLYVRKKAASLSSVIHARQFCASFYFFRSAESSSMTQVRLIKHEAVSKCGSFEVRFSDGTPSQY